MRFDEFAKFMLWSLRSEPALLRGWRVILEAATEANGVSESEPSMQVAFKFVLFDLSGSGTYDLAGAK